MNYKDLDPDQLYYKFPEGSITFFFVPSSGNLYTKPYPTNHQDMLIDDDELFDDVYGDLEWGSRERRNWASRGKALELTNTLLGRIAAVGEDFVVSFWREPPKEHLQQFLNELFEKYPILDKKKDSVIVVTPKSTPYSLSGKPVDDTVTPKETPQNSKKEFKIDGKMYSLQDLQNLRSAVHTKSFLYGDPMTVLCHPDMDKYPALSGYKLANCDPTPQKRQSWKDAGRQAGLPYVYSYGESFKDFVSRKEIGK